METAQINLRGTVFTTSLKTLQNYLETKLASLTHQSDNYNVEKDEYFFDRNPCSFHNILDFYSTGKIHISSAICVESFREELEFWEIPMKYISKCCWKTFYQIGEDMDVLEKIVTRLKCGQEPTNVDYSSLSIVHRLRSRIWQLLTDIQSSTSAKVLHCFLVMAMIVSILVYALETLEICRVDRHGSKMLDSNSSSIKLRLLWNTAPHPVLILLDFATNSILSLELALRIFTCPCIKRFWKSPMNIIDLLSCTGVWLCLAFSEMQPSLSYGPLWIMSCMFGFLYSIRILRLLRMFRFNCGMQILYLSIKSSARELYLLASAFICFVIIFAGFIYVAELQVDTFADMFVSLWWAVITMTTVGYGDHFPSTGTGFLVGTACAIVGILLIALPVAVTSSNFNDFNNFNKYRIRHFHMSRKHEPEKIRQCVKINQMKVKPIDHDKHSTLM
ncbi:potassium voltage-gated channel protein Shaw-like [Argopecten irradians]|uniref:potassium voltage-gated channel protein Shaw-like n=1 Tax=Argopecten irradians TaxID=31199 RepID=UPI00371BDC9A